MQIKFEWEEIFDNRKTNPAGCQHLTYRAKVFRGWLVKHLTNTGTKFTTVMSFVPDENHCWEIE